MKPISSKPASQKRSNTLGVLYCLVVSALAILRWHFYGTTTARQLGDILAIVLPGFGFLYFLAGYFAAGRNMSNPLDKAAHPLWSVAVLLLFVGFLVFVFGFLPKILG